MYAVSGSPAQAVQHAVLEIMPEKPALVVSGINYGENVGFGRHHLRDGRRGHGSRFDGHAGAGGLAGSGHRNYHFSYSKEMDFSAAAYFTAFFGRLLLEKKMPDDVQVLKVDVPSDATVDTAWQVTRLSRQALLRAADPASANRGMCPDRSYY